MDYDNDVLIERLERLERSNRRMKLLSFVVFVAIGTMGAAQGITHTFGVLNAKQINAEGISIIDANGKLRVAIGADPATDQGGMTVFQRDEIARVGIGIDPSRNAAAGFNDPSGTMRTAIVALSDNTGLISTFEPTGSLGAFLFTSPGASGFNGLFLDEPDGVQRARFLSDSTGTSLALLHPNGNGGPGMFEGVDGLFPSMGIGDMNGTLRMGISASDPSTGAPFEFVQINGPDGHTRASVDSGFTASTNGLVRTFDSSGIQNGLLGVP
jgi:hypothetical protein